jgi:hypothetical protein
VDTLEPDGEFSVEQKGGRCHGSARSLVSAELKVYKGASPVRQ